ncbi:Nif3-like dinuclear metal center hexameric protein [Desulfocurvibacter africanus]|uniref:Nif3-like dinuclear metal center hexameric protein n=1 Tax=Desulfocurvibacter africanus TaxID=873 RepID=UPI00041E0D1D|nr:Nif3-like dinuclear metal center hexameric protein [Desulfocurvibacter africanus]
MLDVQEIIRRIEGVAPPRYQADWDRSGVQVAGRATETDRLAVMLDPRPDSVAKALDRGARFILCHHPLSLSPRLPDRLDDYHETLRLLLASDAWLYAAHTSLDCQPLGPAAWLARRLWLVNLRVLQPLADVTASEMRFDLAEPLTAEQKSALLMLNEVASMHEEQGQLRVICESDARRKVVDLLAQATGRSIGYSALTLDEPKRALGFGLLGELKDPLPAKQFLRDLAGCMGRNFWIAAGQEPETISKVAYCPGSGGSLVRRAFELGADVYITGDVKYHEALDAAGLVLDVGHFGLEEKMMQAFHDRLRADLGTQGVEAEFFPGREPMRLVSHGRPE